MTIAEVRFKEEEEVDEKEPLLMEHFSLPIGLWFVGTLISLLCFLAELIIHCYIYKKEGPTARQEEPTETQTESETSQMSKHLGEIVLKKFRTGRLPDTEGAEVDQVQGSKVPDKARVTFQQEVQHNTDVQDIEVVEDIEDMEDIEDIEDKKITLTTYLNAQIYHSGFYTSAPSLL